MSIYRKKTLRVDARQLLDDPRNTAAIARWVEAAGGEVLVPFVPSEMHVLTIVTPEGEVQAGLGDYIVRDDYTFSVYREAAFHAAYESVTA